MFYTVVSTNLNCVARSAKWPPPLYGGGLLGVLGLAVSLRPEAVLTSVLGGGHLAATTTPEQSISFNLTTCTTAGVTTGVLFFQPSLLFKDSVG